MNRHFYTSLAFKIFGLYCVIQGLNSIPFLFKFNFEGWMFLAIGPIFFPLIAGIFLFLFANGIANYLVGPKQDNMVKDTIHIDEIRSVAFSIVGLFILARILPQISQLISPFVWIRVIEDGEISGKMTSLVVEMIPALLIQIFIGLWLFLRPNSVINLLKLKQS